MYEFESRVRYSEVDADGVLTWLALTDYFQDCSVFHSEHHRIGISYLSEHHMAWILSFWQICVGRMPRLAEHITVQTWPYSMKNFYGYRNFCIKDSGGERLAWANSVWVLMDTQTGRPMSVPKEMPEIYGLDAPIPMRECSRKIVVPEAYEEKEPIVVPAYFIDTNRHMNNSRYVQVAQQYIPEGTIADEVRVEYRRAARQSDVIVPRVSVRDGEVIVALCDRGGAPYAVVQFMNGLD